ncbi:MAG TPA: hypothetical protein VL651_03140 [Bacteroidia bacterium]|jgi:hypothetical protein|nr:hypothetical protein [Bacteroidia bacterium]
MANLILRVSFSLVRASLPLLCFLVVWSVSRSLLFHPKDRMSFYRVAFQNHITVNSANVPFIRR